MNPKKIFTFLSVALLFFCRTSLAQNAISYATEADYVNKKGKDIGPVTFDPGQVNYSLHSDYNGINKNFKKRCWGVMSNDSLFVNCRLIFKKPHYRMGDRHIIFHPTGYSYVRFRNSRYLCFCAGRSNVNGMSNKTSNQDCVAAVFLGGAVGGVALASLAATGQKESKLWADKGRYHYMLDLTTNEITYLNRGVMRDMVETLSPKDDADLIAYMKAVIAIEDYTD